jgi:iron complex outermembrane receptor protein
MTRSPKSPSLTPLAAHLAIALATLSLAAPGYAQSVAPAESVVITGKIAKTPPAVETAPSQGSLEARSALSVIGNEFIRNATTPVADYTQIVANTPGAFSYSPNGVGLGDTKITLRGLSDSNMVYAFDGIPFNDTNGVSHHSWAFFPANMLGGVVVDRGPGTAASIGQATFGGSVFLQSRIIEDEKRTSVSATLGTWRTKVGSLEHNTGLFGGDSRSGLLVNVQQLESDGYETFNVQRRKTLSAKYQTTVAPGTQLTGFIGYMELRNNTPNLKGVTRDNVNKGAYDVLLTDDPSRSDYFGYNFYDLYTSFAYVGIATDLGGGWKLEDKVYRYQYHNAQKYSAGTVSVSSGTDKLNSYVTAGNLLRVSQDSAMGTLRTGLWFDRADSRRYQIPADPRTWAIRPSPNFTETYVTTTFQPYVEYAFKVTPNLTATPGLKFASYRQDFVHLQDNSGAVGFLGGTYNSSTGVLTGGQPFIRNAQTYTDTLPALDVHYQIRQNWTAYAQLAAGDQIPSTSIFDVKDAKVSPPPKATKTKTVQFGTVWQSAEMSLAADVYHTQLDGTYSPLPPDANGNFGYVLSGTQVTQGVEVEGNFVIGQGFSVYANAMVGSLKYDSGTISGQWVAGAPSNTETLGLSYKAGAWSTNLSVNRVGQMYNDGKDGTHQAFTIDPVVLTNLFVNYTIREPFSFARSAKIQLGVNNLLNRHSIVAVAGPATNSTSANPLGGDLLTVLPARSILLTATLDF